MSLTADLGGVVLEALLEQAKNMARARKVDVNVGRLPSGNLIVRVGALPEGAKPIATVVWLDGVVQVVVP